MLGGDAGQRQLLERGELLDLDALLQLGVGGLQALDLGRPRVGYRPGVLKGSQRMFAPRTGFFEAFVASLK
ncbi:hypothetical protein [Kitasatospora cineracea]|uniref:hypothetical protein n=1 Tax=Kitasatospora cineracea TaxID=88074 RepID=UPI0033E0C0A6